MSVAQIPVVPPQTQQMGTSSAPHNLPTAQGAGRLGAMDLAAAETVMVIDAEEIPVAVASQVIRASQDVHTENDAGIVSACTTASGCTVRFTDKSNRDKAILAMRLYGQLPYVRAAEVKSMFRSRPRIAAIDCVSWVRAGKCAWDKGCPFRHPPPVARVPCRHWFRNRGECWYGEHCNFLHPGTAVWVEKAALDGDQDGGPGGLGGDEQHRRFDHDAPPAHNHHHQHQQHNSSPLRRQPQGMQQSFERLKVGDGNGGGAGLAQHQREQPQPEYGSMPASSPWGSPSIIPVSSSPRDVPPDRMPVVGLIGSPLSGPWGSQSSRSINTAPIPIAIPDAELELRHRKMEAAFSSVSDEIVMGSSAGSRERANTLGSESAVSLSSSGGRRVCMICEDAERTVALIPCGHHVFCERCTSAEVPAKVSTCPRCSANIAGTLRVYL